MFSLSRRTLLKSGLQLAGSLPAAKLIGFQTAAAQNIAFKHGLSLLGDLKYAADFKNYDYANPQAPKGGKLRLGFLGSFDTMNPYNIKGDPFAAAQGEISVDDAAESLMTKPFDEAGATYGLIASGVSHPDDYSSVTFQLRPEAKFHDGKQISVEDVIWSFTELKKNLPAYAGYYKNVVKVEETGERQVTFSFDQKGNRELPSIVGEFPILPKHWWTGVDATGKPRDIAASSMEVPLGSGPYRVTEVKAGQFVRMVRVKDYWGANLAVNAGRHNFDDVEILFFKDGVVAFEAFKGDQYDFRWENSSKQWATGYDFPAVKDGRCIKAEIKLENVEPIQGWVLNLRNEKFSDVRVRKALNFAFDFEWTNKNLFYGIYSRCRSAFNNSIFEAKGLPSPEELALLEPLRAQLPPEVFTEEFTNPVNGDATTRRANLREASKLLDEAGWAVTQDGTKSVRKNAKGEKFEISFVLDSPLFERIALPYVQELESLGITCNVRTVDASQYERLTENYEYDIISGIWGQSLFPGNEQRDFWGSEAANKKGSRNAAGIKDPAIDALIEKIVFAKDRAAQIVACKALDRALMHKHFLVPMWFSPADRIAYWDRMGRPDKVPAHSIGFSSTWWAKT